MCCKNYRRVGNSCRGINNTIYNLQIILNLNKLCKLFQLYTLKECFPGTFGIDCKEDCPQNYYGRLCKEKCLCKDCDKVNGCSSKYIT